MTPAIAILLGIVVLAVIGFAVWYISTQNARLAQQQHVSGLPQIGAGLGQAVQGIFSFLS